MFLTRCHCCCQMVGVRTELVGGEPVKISTFQLINKNHGNI